MPYQDHTNVESWTRSFLTAGFTHDESEYLRENPCLIDLHHHYARCIIETDDLDLREHYRLMCITVRNAIFQSSFLTGGAWDSWYRSLKATYEAELDRSLRGDKSLSPISIQKIETRYRPYYKPQYQYRTTIQVLFYGESHGDFWGEGQNEIESLNLAFESLKRYALFINVGESINVK